MSEPREDRRDELDDDDALGGLRDAWRALPAPDPERGAGDVESEAVVAWMRGAWRALEAPAPTGSAQLRARSSARAPRPRVASRAVWIGLAAAAALALWFLAGRRDDGATNDVHVASGPDGRAPSGGAADPETAHEPDVLAPIEITAIAPERMELRSGAVRLVLLDGWTKTTGTDEGSTSDDENNDRINDQINGQIDDQIDDQIDER